ncbi:MAG: hypothetical protein ACYC97_06380 [Metallibacterium sp.]
MNFPVVRFTASGALVVVAFAGALVMSAAVLAHASSNAADSACAAGAAADAYPANAVPGPYALERGMRVLRHKHLRDAVGRFKVAASWGSKIAEYNLGLMYWNGDGVRKDYAKAVAWLALADQRHNSAKIDGSLQYAYAKLTLAERKQADADFGAMVDTYGDAVALKRARAAWRRAARSATGSRVGAGGDLSGDAGIRESELHCNPYWPYPLKEDLAGHSKHQKSGS